MPQEFRRVVALPRLIALTPLSGKDLAHGLDESELSRIVAYCLEEVAQLLAEASLPYEMDSLELGSEFLHAEISSTETSQQWLGISAVEANKLSRQQSGSLDGAATTDLGGRLECLFG